MFKWFIKMNLIQKLIVFFIFLIVMPILLVDWFVSDKVATISEDQMGNTLLQLVKTSHLTLDRDITFMDGVTEKLMIADATQKMFDLSPLSEYERFQLYKSLDSLIAAYSTNYNFSIFIPELTERYPFAPTSEALQKGVFYAANIAKMSWFQDAIEARGSGITRTITQLGFNPTHLKTLAYIRKMNNTSGGDSLVGVLVVTGLDSLLEKDLNSLKIPKDSLIALVNNKNEILTSTSNLEIGAKFELPSPVSNTLEGVYTEKEKGRYWLYAFHTSSDSDTKLLFKIPVSSIIGEHLAVRQLFNYLMIAYFLILIILSIYFFRYILNPLSRLARFTRAYEPGRPLTIEYRLDRKDEIGLLNNAFIDMTKRLNQTIHDKYVLELKQKEVELTILHSQINPHLLYNTLESIYWRTTIEGNSESAEMIHDLSMFMRIGLSRGKTLIQISEELTHVEAYLRLQLKRYNYSFKINWDIDEDAKSFLIPKVVLQPLAENAIIHGIRNMEQDGELWIVIKTIDGKVEIFIEDNGYKAADMSKLNAILDGNERNAGYGILNVNKRIKLHFGNSFGLSYELRPEGGTRAMIIIPATTEEI
jgi:two-component system, sensor histidine kinase YesM